MMVAAPRMIVAFLFTLSLVVVFPAPTFAQPAAGDLDRSFGTDGKVRTDFGGWDSARSVAIDSHGRIIAAGETSPSQRSIDFAIARYRHSGRLDRSFSGNGKVVTDLGGFHLAKSVAIDSRDRIVVAGAYGRPGPFRPFNHVTLARYTPNGSLDTSFSSDGKLTMEFGGGRKDHARAVAVDSHDRIVIAGPSEGDFAVARYKWNGTLDTSFGSNGMVTTDFGDHAVARAVAIDSRDGIVAAGHTRNGSDSDFALARYESDGSLDASFSGNGKVTTPFGLRSYVTSVAIDPHNRIVAAGSEGDFALARYHRDGSLDRSFGGNGKVTTAFRPSGAQANAVAIDSHNRLVAAGHSVHRSVLARYRPSGVLDHSFSRNGKAMRFSPSRGAQAGTIDSRDRIVVAGGSGNFALYRFIGYRRR
jgi:uncharacterized delta-60 repeat protein